MKDFNIRMQDGSTQSVKGGKVQIIENVTTFWYQDEEGNFCITEMFSGGKVCTAPTYIEAIQKAHAYLHECSTRELYGRLNAISSKYGRAN